MNGVIIRAALPGDAAAVREIYRWYVENTAVTYDYAISIIWLKRFTASARVSFSFTAKAAR